MRRKQAETSFDLEPLMEEKYSCSDARRVDEKCMYTRCIRSYYRDGRSRSAVAFATHPTSCMIKWRQMYIRSAPPLRGMSFRRTLLRSCDWIGIGLRYHIRHHLTYQKAACRSLYHCFLDMYLNSQLASCITDMQVACALPVS